MNDDAGSPVRRMLITADTVGGVWTHAYELIRVLAGRGVEVALATMGAPINGEQRASVADIPHLAVFESGYKLEWMDDPWQDVAAAGEWLLGVAAQFQPDVVHLNSFAHGALAWNAPVLVVGHSCVASWWEAVKGEAVPESWNAYRDAVRAGLQAANMVAAPTRAMLESLQKHYGPLANAIVVPNGRDANLFRPAAKEQLVFSAGRLWDDAKNIKAVDDVAARLPWPVYVAGEARHPSGGTYQVSNAKFLGVLPPAEVAQWMARAAIYALPARYEPFGLTALEAALCGCALVLGDIPSLREVWEDAAFYVPPDDRAALEAAIRSLIGDPSARAARAMAARGRALEFTPERMAQQYIEAYAGLVGQRHLAAGG